MKKKTVKSQPRKKIIVELFIFTIVAILGMSIGYSVFNANLSISGDAYVRVDEEIRVIDFKVIEQTNGAYETYNKKYAKDTTTMFATLPNDNSTITYEVTVRNKSSKMYQLKDIIEESNPNANISYEVMNIKIKDLVKKDSTITFQIKLTTSLMDQKTELKLKYLFTLSTACEYDPGQTFTFAYTGASQTFQVPCDGTYKLETWGAQGGNYGSILGGKGAYVSGEIDLSRDNLLYVYVGENYNSFRITESFNGGGHGSHGTLERNVMTNGGGATDIRLVNGNWNNFDSLKSRIMVAAGGGGCTKYIDKSANGGNAGALTGGSGTLVTYWNTVGSAIKGGSQTATFFGYGQNAAAYEGAYVYGSGGGGGYYGGNAGAGVGDRTVSSAGGGSSFISGYSGCNAISIESTETKIIHTGQPNHYSDYVFQNTKMLAGSSNMPNHTGTATTVGHSGNGYAKITYLQ